MRKCECHLNPALNLTGFSSHLHRSNNQGNDMDSGCLYVTPVDMLLIRR